MTSPPIAHSITRKRRHLSSIAKQTAGIASAHAPRAARILTCLLTEGLPPNQKSQQRCSRRNSASILATKNPSTKPRHQPFRSMLSFARCLKTFCLISFHSAMARTALRFLTKTKVAKSYRYSAVTGSRKQRLRTAVSHGVQAISRFHTGFGYCRIQRAA